MTKIQFGVLDFQVEVEVYARAGFLLLCITTFVSRTIEILCLHTLTLTLKNLKLQIVCAQMSSSYLQIDAQNLMSAFRIGHIKCQPEVNLSKECPNRWPLWWGKP